MDNKIWIEDVEILFREDKLREFIPLDTMSDYEKVNAITRFSIYFSIVLYILKDDIKYFYIPFLTCIVIYFLYSVNTTGQRFEDIDDSYVDIKPKKANYKLPSKNNPFMNLNITDYGTSKISKPALKGNKVNKIVSSYFDKMYKNTDDLHDKETFLRQYYTMPVTTVPDNRLKFAKWCYRGKRKCKTNNDCYNNVYSPLNNVLHR